MGLGPLKDFLKSMGARHPSFGKRLREAEALGRWEEAVGKQIAKHSRALTVKDEILWIEVDHPVWHQELQLRKHQILEILNQNPSETALKDLYFVSRRPGRNPN